MGVSGRTSVAVLLALAAPGCGGSEDRAQEAPIPLGDPPAAVRDACRDTEATFAVRCPARWPSVPGSRPKLQRLGDGDRYQLSINDSAFRTADVGHILVGGQTRELPLAGDRGDRWPGAPALGLLKGGAIVGTGSVGAARALVVRMPRYPRGGVHGGHVVALWNSGGHGYAVSLHFSGYPLADRIATVLALARSAA